jgi:hypothetical protein
MYFYSLSVTKLMAGDETKKIKCIFFEIEPYLTQIKPLRKGLYYDCLLFKKI